MAWPTTQVATGDLVTAAQLNQLPIALAKATGAAASYDFQSIPQVWSGLLLVCSLQSDSTNNQDDLSLRFNNDTGSRYYRQRIRGSGATASAAESLAATSMLIGQITGKSAGAMSSFAMWVPNYTTATVRRSVTSTGGNAFGLATGNLVAETYFGFWDNTTDAVSRITIFPAAGLFTSTSTAYLYALGTI